MRNTRFYTAGGFVILLLVFFLLQLGCGGGDAPAKKTDETAKDTAADTAEPDDTTEETPVAVAEYVCPMHPDEKSTNPDDECPQCGMKLELVGETTEAIPIYTCPIHPEEHSINPDDKCPICGMEFELQSHDEEETEDGDEEHPN